MFRKLLTLATVFVASVVGFNAYAQKANLTTAKGWSQVTALPTDVDQYFFAIYDHSNDLGMVLKTGANQGNGYQTMWYTAATNPETNKAAVWKIAKDGDAGEYAVLTNATNPDYFLQTEWGAAQNYRTHDNGGGDNSWGRVTLAYSTDAKAWTFKNGKYPDDGYLGAWTGTIGDGAEIALNKKDKEIGQFDIYQISRGKYVELFEKTFPADITYVITNPNASWKMYGWTMEAPAPNSTYYIFQNQSNGVLGNAVAPNNWNGNPFFWESWQASGKLSNRSMSQTVTGLPDGNYKLELTTQTTAAGAFLFMNDKKIELNTQEGGVAVLDKVTVIGGKITFGVKLDNYQANQVCFDNFKLTQLSNFAIDKAEITAKYEVVRKKWQEENTKVNVWDNEIPDEVWKSTVKNDALDLMNKSNDLLLASMDELDKHYAAGDISDARADIEKMISDADQLIDDADVLATNNYAVAKAALEVAKAIPAGTYYIKEVSTGKYLGPGNGWQTQASLLDYSVEWKLAMLKNGVYTFESVVSQGKDDKGVERYYFNGTYCDQYATNIIISAGSADGQFKFQTANEKYETDGSKYIQKDGSTVKVGNSAAEFVLVPTNDAKKLNEGDDVTFFIKDANLGRNNRFYSAWSVSGGATAPKTSDSSVGENSRYSQESYQKAFNVNQNLTVPNGYYTLNVQAFYRQDGKKEALPVIFANAEEKGVKKLTSGENNMQQAAVTFEKLEDTYKNTVEVHVTDGKLNIGIKAEDNSAWSIWKNFTLIYKKDNNAAFDAQLLDKMTEAWNKADANYTTVKGRVADYDAKGEIRKALDLVLNNNTTTIDGKDAKGNPIKIRNGWGINDAYTTNAYVKSLESKADSLNKVLSDLAAGLNNYIDGIEIAKQLKKDVDDLHPLWQATYDIINTKYNAEKILDPADKTEFKKEMADLRAEFVKELNELNTIEATFSTIKDQTIEKSLTAGKLKDDKATISAQISGLKDQIIATLNDAQTKSYKALEDAYNDRDALYIAAIEVINKHYAGEHKAIADATNLKLFAIHKALAKIYDDATAEYAAVVAANKKALDSKALPTEGFGYANYIRGLEDVNVADIAVYLNDANTAAIADNNAYINDNLRKTEIKDGKVVSDTGVQAIEAAFFAKAVKGTDYATLTKEKIAANADKKYNEAIVDVCKKMITLEDTLKFYQGKHEAKYMDGATLKSLRDKGIKIYKLDKDGKETTEAKDTVICVLDVADFITSAFDELNAAVTAVSDAVDYSLTAKKNEIEPKNTALKTLWNKSYAGMNDKLDPEVDLQEIYDGIEDIRINRLTNNLYLYDEAAVAEDMADMEMWEMALTDYDKWVTTYHEPGDANLDGEVTVADVILEVSYLLEEEKIPATKLNKYVTDADGDGAFDINDLQWTINKALGDYEEEEEEEAADAPKRVIADITDYVVVGKSELGLVNTKAYASFQMDVTVAEGVTFNAPTLTDRAAQFTVKYSKIGDNTYRVLGYNMKKATIEENEGVFMQLNINGDSQVAVTNAIFSDGKAKYVLTVLTEDEVAALEEETAIAGINAEVENGAEIYSIGGAKLNKLQKGVNVVKKADGTVRKVFVK